METKPAILTVFGASGDLMSKKIIPALYSLFENGKLPTKFKVIGVGRSDYSGDKFCKEIVVKSIKKHLNVDFPDDQCFTFFEYLQGDINDPSLYSNLEKRLSELDGIYGEESNKLFYYSVYSDLYETLTENISKICKNKSHVRLLVEKPYGQSEADAKKLDSGIKQYFEEENIFRVDHYLEKEILKQIDNVKSRSEYAERWNKDHIKSIENIAWEDFGVEDRGKFYEGVGALLDVGQNHLLSNLSLILTAPGNTERDHRAGALECLRQFSQDEIMVNSKRAQYSGYLEIEGVNPNSEIETYFKLDFELEEEWEGVSVVMEGGKELPEQHKFISVNFEHEELIFEYFPTACVYSKTESGKKKILQCAETEHQYVAEYSNVILDAIAMDSKHFLSIDEVLAQWRFIDPIRSSWDEGDVELESYEKGTLPE